LKAVKHLQALKNLMKEKLNKLQTGTPQLEEKIEVAQNDSNSPTFFQ